MICSIRLPQAAQLRGDYKMCQVSVSVPDAVLFDTHMDIHQAAAFARGMVALGFYVHNNVSIGYCAEIAGMTEEEFIAFLGKNHVDVFQFDDDEELLRDVANA